MVINWLAVIEQCDRPGVCSCQCSVLICINSKHAYMYEPEYTAAILLRVANGEKSLLQLRIEAYWTGGGTLYSWHPGNKKRWMG